MLALSDEDPEKVAAFLDQNGYTVRTAAGSTCGSQKYGVRGIPDSVLIGPDGKIVYRGHPGSLSTGKIKEALKGAKKPPRGGFLAVPTTVEASGKLKSAVTHALEGKLGRALAAAEKIAQDEKADPAERESAQRLIEEILDHGQMLNEQAAKLLGRLDVVTAVMVYERVADELAGTEVGDRAKDELDRIAKDERLQKELEAGEAFAKMRKSIAKLSTSKKRKKYEQFVKKHAGTKAAERARSWLRANG